MDAEALLDLVRGHWGVENGLHRTLDVQFREDDCRIRTGHGPAVMGILRRAALNMVRTGQQNLDSFVSIGLLRDRIGRQPWSPACPEHDFAFALGLPQGRSASIVGSRSTEHLLGRCQCVIPTPSLVQASGIFIPKTVHTIVSQV